MMDNNNLEIEILKLKSTIEAQEETIRDLNKRIGLHTTLLKIIIEKTKIDLL